MVKRHQAMEDYGKSVGNRILLGRGRAEWVQRRALMARREEKESILVCVRDFVGKQEYLSLIREYPHSFQSDIVRISRQQSLSKYQKRLTQVLVMTTLAMPRRAADAINGDLLVPVNCTSHSEKTPERIAATLFKVLIIPNSAFKLLPALSNFLL